MVGGLGFRVFDNHPYAPRQTTANPKPETLHPTPSGPGPSLGGPAGGRCPSALTTPPHKSRVVGLGFRDPSQYGGKAGKTWKFGMLLPASGLGSGRFSKYVADELFCAS